MNMNQRKLEELFQYTYNIDDSSEWWLYNMDWIMRSINKETIKEIIRFLNMYRKELIENTFKAYPMNVDALNCRNWSVTVLWDIIKFMSRYTKDMIDPEFRDNWELRQKLNEENEKNREVKLID